MTINRAIRASDQEREQVIEILRTQYSNGRLTLEEFDERMAAAYEARTWGDLLQQTNDLPVQVRLGSDQAMTAATDRPPAAGRRLRPVFPLIALLPLVFAVALVSSALWDGPRYGPYHHHFVGVFPLVPLLVATALLLRHRRWGRGG